jgi:hypothetical protein
LQIYESVTRDIVKRAYIGKYVGYIGYSGYIGGDIEGK